MVCSKPHAISYFYLIKNALSSDFYDIIKALYTIRFEIVIDDRACAVRRPRERNINVLLLTFTLY